MADGEHQARTPARPPAPAESAASSPVGAAIDRGAAARQLHRSLTAWRSRDATDDDDAVDNDEAEGDTERAGAEEAGAEVEPRTLAPKRQPNGNVRASDLRRSLHPKLMLARESGDPRWPGATQGLPVETIPPSAITPDGPPVEASGRFVQNLHVTVKGATHPIGQSYWPGQKDAAGTFVPSANGPELDIQNELPLGSPRFKLEVAGGGLTVACLRLQEAEFGKIGFPAVGRTQASLGDANLFNFQLELLKRTAAGRPKADDPAVASAAVADISFGTARKTLGYRTFSVTVMDAWTKVSQIDGLKDDARARANPNLLVPMNVHAVATK